mgnify:CR=1 FL=1
MKTIAKRKRGKGTKTRSFGVSSRESHDSSKFYDSKLYNEKKVKKIKYIENHISKEYLNQIFHKSSEKMDELPDNSVHLMVTSPPYNVGKDYDDDLTLDEYIRLIRDVMEEVYRVLVPGGRVCLNITNVGRKPYIPLHKYAMHEMLDIGYMMRGEVIWDKSASAGTSTAWGSWQSASNPTLRDTHEYILVFCKQAFSRKKSKGRESTISREEFLEYTKSIWSFAAESAKRIGHPAPFPVELPYRCIQLYSFEDDIILDPFMGSGTTAIASIRTNRRYVGYEKNPTYIELANKRIKDELCQKSIKSYIK